MYHKILIDETHTDWSNKLYVPLWWNSVGSHFNQWSYARWIVSLEVIISSVGRRKANGCAQSLLEKLDVQHK